MAAAKGKKPTYNDLRKRVRQLEESLWRIGAELETCGITLGPIKLPGSGKIPPALYTLTRREHEVLSHLRRGARVPSIARRLQISPSTVRNHLQSIFRKLGVGSQAELLEKLQSTPAFTPGRSR